MDSTEKLSPGKAFVAGAIGQALVLGTLLFLAIFELLCFSADAQLFRYQGF